MPLVPCRPKNATSGRNTILAVQVRIEDFARYLRKIGDRFDNLDQERVAAEEDVRRKVSFTSGLRCTEHSRGCAMKFAAQGLSRPCLLIA